MAKVNFRIRSSANKEVSIYIYLSAGRDKMYQCKTGFTINPKDWSSATNKPKQNQESNKSIFNNLSKLESYIYESLNKANSSGQEVNTEWLLIQTDKCFNRISKKDTSLLTTHCQHIIDNASSRVISRKKIGLSKERVKSYCTTLKIIQRFESINKKPIHFQDINKSFIEKFKNWLLNDEKYSINHAGKQIDNIKTICLDAEKNDIPVNLFISKIESFSESNEDRHIVTLSIEELDKIEQATITKEALINARKWLLIGCEIGQRVSDLLRISQSDLINANGLVTIELKQKKTNKDVTIPVLPRTKRILESGFPYKISDQRFNEYIKEVCKLAQIDEVVEGKKMDKKSKRAKLGFYPKHELITSHTCRRSYATNYYKHIPTPVLMEITAHAKESTFLAYINKPKDKEENARLMYKYFELMQEKQNKDI